jgi:hypothetical protein
VDAPYRHIRDACSANGSLAVRRVFEIAGVAGALPLDDDLAAAHRDA